MNAARLALTAALVTWGGLGAALAEDEAPLLESEGGTNKGTRPGLDIHTFAEFRKLDRDGDGHLSPREFSESEIISRAGSALDREERTHLFSRIDADGDGAIGLFEFAGSQHNRNARLIDDDATRDYVEIDDDLDGLLQEQEFSARPLEKLPRLLVGDSPADPAKIFARIDLNHSRVIGPFEFMQGSQDRDCHFMSAESARDFAELDANDNGAVEQGEFSESAEGRDRDAGAFGRIDFNGNGELSPREFARARSIQPGGAQPVDEQTSEAFRELDRNRNGVVSRREFSRSFFARSMAKDRDAVDANFSQRDEDADGELTLEEFASGRHFPWRTMRK